MECQVSSLFDVCGCKQYYMPGNVTAVSLYSAVTLLVRRQEGHSSRKKHRCGNIGAFGDLWLSG